MASAPVRILVVDDSRLYREALATALADEPWIASIEMADDLAAVPSHGFAFPPTVTLLNVSTEGSLDLLAWLSGAGGRVVVLGVRENEAEVVSCAERGAAGYLMRSDSIGALRDVIQAVARGEAICSPKTTAALLRRVAALAAERRSRQGLGLLTPREMEILSLIERGLPNRDIACELGIEVRTVKNHVHAILGKLGVRRRGQAAASSRTARRVLVPPAGKVGSDGPFREP